MYPDIVYNTLFITIFLFNISVMIPTEKLVAVVH